MKILCVGDIHCKKWIIDEVEKIVDNYDSIVFLGDYVDDWHSTPIDSMATLRKIKLLHEKYQNEIKLVIGNHDFAYLHSEIAGRSSGWHGMTQLMIDAPENKHIKDWLLSLSITIELDSITFSHAGITEDWNTETDVFSLWCDNSPIWARPEYSNYKKIKQVFGHTPQKTCTEIEYGIWCIDTFSLHRDGKPVGDQTVLEIIDGKIFNILKLKEIKHENNNSSTSITS